MPRLTDRRAMVAAIVPITVTQGISRGFIESTRAKSAYQCNQETHSTSKVTSCLARTCGGNTSTTLCLINAL